MNSRRRARVLFLEIVLRKRTALDPAALVPFGGGAGFRIRGLVFRGRAYRAAVIAGVGAGMRSGAGVSGKREEGGQREGQERGREKLRWAHVGIQRRCPSLSIAIQVTSINPTRMITHSAALSRSYKGTAGISPAWTMLGSAGVRVSVSPSCSSFIFPRTFMPRSGDVKAGATVTLATVA